MLKKYIYRFLGLLVMFIVMNAEPIFSQTLPEYVKTGLIYSDDFSEGLNNWVVEQTPEGTTKVNNGELEIDGGGTTVWFKHRISGPVCFEYDAILIQNSGPNDNCRDLNCFWMAVAPKNPADLFDGWRSNSKQRGGVFASYHQLRTYYAGIGGHKNTTSRFRRYSGHGNRPLLPEHDLADNEFLLVPNKKLHVKIIACNEIIQYYINDRLFFDFRDPQPYTYGWFGFRTVSNHVKIDNFKVYKLNPVANVFGYPGYTPEQEKNAHALGLNNGLTELSGRKGWRNQEFFKTDNGFLSEKVEFFDGQTNGKVWRLTNHPSIENNVYTDLPVWSANGKYMMFVSYRNGKPERWMMNANGQNLKPMPEFCQGEDMFWSVHDPDIIIFSKKINNQNEVLTGVFKGNVVTGKVESLVQVSGDLGIMQPPHPSEKYFLFGDFMGGQWTEKEHPSRAFVVDIKSKVSVIEFEKLYHRLRFTKSADARVFFNFDNPRQTFSCDRNGDNRIEIPFNGGHPDWLPEGKLLIFNAREVLPDGTKNFDIRYDAVLPDGTGLHTLYPFGGHASACADGQYIVCDGGEGAGSINYVNINKPYNAQQLFFTQTSRYDHTNNWHPHHHSTHPHPNSSPDGTKVLCNSDVGGQFTDIYVTIAHLPDAPKNLKTANSANKIKLTWEKPTRSNETEGYFIYQSAQSGKDFKRINEKPVQSTEITIENEPQEQYFVVTAVEYSGLESTPSNEVFEQGKNNWPQKIRMWVEAENMTLASPLVQKMNMKKTSNGYFICPKDSKKNGMAVFTTELPDSGNYVLWARLKNMGNLQVEVNKILAGSLAGINEAWIWQRTNTFVAKKGKNDWQLLFSEGVEQVDKILITNDFFFTPFGIEKLDKEAPQPPEPLSAKGISENTILVEWAKSSSADAVVYHVYAGNSPDFTCSVKQRVASVADLRFIDCGLPLNTKKWYKITAADIDGNESEPGIVISASTLFFVPTRIHLHVNNASFKNFKLEESQQTKELMLMPSEMESTANWEFEIDQPGEYAVWFRSEKSTEKSDSYQIEIDNGQIFKAQVFGLYNFVNWVQAGHIVAGSPQVFSFKKGKHSITFKLTEGKAPVGEVVITNDPTWWPVNSMKSTGY